jgi:hypothetical protein
MMDTLKQPEAGLRPERITIPVAVSLEVVLWIGLLALALCLRLADLGTAALNDAEAHEALAAWRFVRLDAAGSMPLVHSPLTFVLNSLLFSVAGGSDLLARLPTALLGLGLVFTPLLWRRELGRVTALLAGLFLTFSAAMLVDARTLSPAIGSMLLAVLGLWLFRQFVQAKRPIAAVLATMSAGGVLLLSDPAGFVLLAILGVAWLFANVLSAEDAPQTQPGVWMRAALAAWPWRDAILAAIVLVAVVGTVFLLYPAGLTQVGDVLAIGLHGVVSRPEGYLAAFPIWVTLLYEPLLWVVGVFGVWRALRQGTFLGRFLVGWLVGGLLASILYAGAGPEYALWLVIPLALLAADVVAELLRPVIDPIWNVPGWAVPTLAMGTAALLAVSTINFVWGARRLATTVDLAAVQVDTLHLLLGGMSLLLIVILFFLAGSLWGTQAALKGIALGVVAFLFVQGAASAWRVAVTNLDNPVELWHVPAANRPLGLLRETVDEISYRDNGTAGRMAFIAQVPEDGAVAWLLRDYTDLRFVSEVDRRATDPLIVAPETFQPDTLGAAYVGQDFYLTKTWDLGSLRWVDVPLWLLYRESSVAPQVSGRVVVWAREDLYGLPPAITGEEIVP